MNQPPAAPSSATVLVERDGTVATLTLNRPNARNAINAQLAQSLCDAVTACQDMSAIVITGAGPSFCAGLDLRDVGVEKLADLPRYIDALTASSVPIIAAVNGPAVTGGFEIALVADFIVASDRAAFADTHARIGVYPGPVLVDLPRRVGMAWAREISLTGNFVDAQTALRIGLVNHVVEPEQLLATAQALGSAIRAGDAAMIAAMRRDWDESHGGPIAEARDIHDRHAQAGGYRQSSRASTLQKQHDEAITHSRAQRDSR